MTALNPFEGPPVVEDPAEDVEFLEMLQRSDERAGRKPDPKLADLLAQAKARQKTEAQLRE